MLCSSSDINVSAQSRDARQNPAPATLESSPEVSPASADLAITATVTARELRFNVVPNTKVEFTGRPERKTEWSAERLNLPQQVQPGVTYRDIGIRLKIVSVFADIDRIVAEALGEAPANVSEQKEQEAASPQTQPSPQTPQPRGDRP